MLFDYHIHSKYSVLDSRSEIADILKRGKSIGLGAIAISDHDAIEGALKAMIFSSREFIVIPAMEISSREGHIVGLGLRKAIERDLSAEETVKRIHELGGLAIAAHPYDSFRSGVGDLCWKLGFDAIEVNGHCLYGNSKAEKAAKEHGIPLVGGSDAHSVDEIGSICTLVSGGSAAEILDAIRCGRCRPVHKKNKASLKASIVLGKVSRKYQKARRMWPGSQS